MTFIFSCEMPYQIAPPLIIIAVAFTTAGVAMGAINKYAFRGNQVRVVLKMFHAFFKAFVSST